jgi:Ca2+-binding RTX toxin-like protein
MTTINTTPIWGNDKSERIDGSKYNDFIGGNGGNDTLVGGAGNDTLISGDDKDTPDRFGNDLLIGGAGNDLLLGENGADRLFGGAGNDTAWGGAQNDNMHGGLGNDLLGGDEGNDKVNGNQGNDTIWGGDGQDTLNGGHGNDFIGGDAGADTIYGGVGADTLYGGDGDDFIFVSRDDAEVSSESGNDTIVVMGYDRDLRINLGEGNDVVDLSWLGYDLNDAQLSALLPDFNQANDTLIQASTAGAEGASIAIEALYDGLFDRASDAAGKAGWLKQMEQGTTLKQIANHFTNSKEFQANYGEMNNKAFLVELYDNFFDRAPDSAGITAWLGGMNNGLTHADVTLAFMQSVEYQADFMSDYLA